MSALAFVARHAQCITHLWTRRIEVSMRRMRVSEQRLRAQGLVEYGLILALVAVLAIASLLLFRPSLPSLLSNLSTSV
jgi:hypothetical protein